VATRRDQRRKRVRRPGRLGRHEVWLVAGGHRQPTTQSGRRLDAPAPPARAPAPDGYGDTGFQASGVDFPTEGCWEVTGTLPTTRLTFVTFVIKKRA
jgi:hypothetical protein